MVELERKYVVFPGSKEEFASWMDFEHFIKNIVPNEHRNGVYHIRTKLGYCPTGNLPPKSVAIFRMEGLHLGHARIQTGVRTQIDPERREDYPFFVTFDPDSVELFKTRLSMADMRKIYGKNYHTRVYLKLNREQYEAVAKAGRVKPL